MQVCDWPIFQRHAQCLQTRDVPGQLEDPQDAHDAEYLGDAPHFHLAEALVLARTPYEVNCVSESNLLVY